MYKHYYAEQLIDDQRECRDRERRAFDHAIDLLEKAKVAGSRSKECEEALSFSCALWESLIGELVGDENDLPAALRGQLVSVGVWILKEAALIRRGESSGFSGIIEVCSMIRNGLT
ncbi:flagellar biosynthesis regulator FlaF [Methylocapsa acidiphila]|uniref:flagellar biosynthesis regulator FlaF n=1 Tax=Methylocapsa acidiphila TaxID=133552 RepID=UPI000A03780D|nr:flagellar biosynthesis regulator FlaF [Methylocapsa acidiphila]